MLKLRREVEFELLQRAAKPRPFSAEEGLALMVDLNLSKYQYLDLRIQAKKVGSDIFPDYNRVLSVKQQCYPANIEITEHSAAVELQDLLTHTASRLLETLSESTLSIMEDQLTFCEMGM